MEASLLFIQLPYTTHREKTHCLPLMLCCLKIVCQNQVRFCGCLCYNHLFHSYVKKILISCQKNTVFKEVFFQPPLFCFAYVLCNTNPRHIFPFCLYMKSLSRQKEAMGRHSLENIVLEGTKCSLLSKPVTDVSYWLENLYTQGLLKRLLASIIDSFLEP